MHELVTSMLLSVLMSCWMSSSETPWKQMLLRDSVPSPPNALGSNGMFTSSTLAMKGFPSWKHGVNVTFPALRDVSANSVMVFFPAMKKM